MSTTLPSVTPARGLSSLGSQTIVGASPALHAAVDRARALADAGARGVFLAGEAGTGKELLARGLHYASAAHEPFLSVGAASIPEHLLSPELFGTHPTFRADGPPPRRGLLELAGAGTVFIDEITRIPAALQRRLLQAIEEGTIVREGGDAPVRVACRVIVGTTASPERALARGELHPPLAARLAGARVDLPPLRERGDDPELLAQYFLHLLADEHGFAVKRLDPAAAEVLTGHGWPGNVRELRQVVERAAVLAEGPAIRAEHVVVQHRTARSGASHGVPAAAEIRLPREGKTLAQIEGEAVALTLQLTGGNRSAAARLLGISRPTLARILRREGKDGEGV